MKFNTALTKKVKATFGFLFNVIDSTVIQAFENSVPPNSGWIWIEE